MSELLWLSGTDDAVVENADWVEISTLFRHDRSVSREDLARALNRARGNLDDNGTSSTQLGPGGRAKPDQSRASLDRAREMADAVFVELRNRLEVCSCGDPRSTSVYPFQLNEQADLLTLDDGAFADSDAGLLYLFLLGICRASMASSKRKLANVDPTSLFEQLCADVLVQFWGGRSSHSDVLNMGTAGRKGGRHHFPAKVEELCSCIGEGAGWKTDARSPGAGDAKVDLVVWRKFSDRRRGGLVGFAQCKTGVHWRNGLGRLRPMGFCRNFMIDPPILEPVSIYMVPWRIHHPRWDDDMNTSASLLFDRCRIVQFGSNASVDLMAKCRTWLEAAMRSFGERAK